MKKIKVLTGSEKGEGGLGGRARDKEAEGGDEEGTADGA